ncbi:MAG: leucine--tRNA ligase [Pseudomonadota bacterium]
MTIGQNLQNAAIKWQKIFEKNKVFSCLKNDQVQFDNFNNSKNISNDNQNLNGNKQAKNNQNHAAKKINITPMFPYPSGDIHLGHILNYTIGDVQAYKKRLEGYDVLHSIGWDSFGLPAENAAIKHNIHPMKWTMGNIDKMNEILKFFSFDMSQQVITCSKQFYKITQEIFLLLFKKGLAYQKESLVNWDPVDQTVLANEQVVDGKGWRSGAKIEKKVLKQWHLRITKYADRLLDNIDLLSDWPSKVKLMQRNWIGKHAGVVINGLIASGNFDSSIEIDMTNSNTNKHIKLLDNIDQNIEIFVNKADRVVYASYVAINDKHKLVEQLNLTSKLNIDELSTFDVNNIDDSVSGIFTGYYIFNVLSRRYLPLYLVNHIDDENTGIVFDMGSKVDKAFIEKYKINTVNIEENVVHSSMKNNINQDYVRYGDMQYIVDNRHHIANDNIVNIIEFIKNVSMQKILNIIDNADDVNRAIRDLIIENNIGYEKIVYKLNDWGISRQRYWGCPIPIIHCIKCGPQANDSLPVELPEDIDLQTSFSLKNHSTWKNDKCPKCGEVAERETDTLDTFMCSSWYYLQYCSLNDISSISSANVSDMRKRLQENNIDNQIFNIQNIAQWMPVDLYIGGAEHAIMHLLYARFINHVLFDCGLSSVEEPFKKLFTQGMLLHEIYKDRNGEYIEPHRVYNKNGKLLNKLDDSLVTTHGIEKMSKSKKNIISAAYAMENYGFDTIRLFLMSDAPLTKDVIWSEERIQGVANFLKKLHLRATSLNDISNDITSYKVDSIANSKDEFIKIGRVDIRKTCVKNIHKTIQLVSESIDNIAYNKAVAYIRELYNFRVKNRYEEILVMHNILILLFPFIPFWASEIYEDCMSDYDKYRVDLGVQKSDYLYNHQWPVYNDEYIVDDSMISLVIQINGKKREIYMINIEDDINAHIDKIKQLNKVKNILLDKKIKKVICIPKKLVNFVI